MLPQQVVTFGCEPQRYEVKGSSRAKARVRGGLRERKRAQSELGEELMAQEGYPPGEKVGTTYIKPAGQGWKKVTYTVVGDLAIFEGCIVLGTVEEMKAIAAFIDENPGILHPGTQAFAVAIKGVQYRWKNHLVPYEIDANLP